MLATLLAAAGCTGPSETVTEVTVAAAANLEPVLPRLAETYEQETGVRITLSFGSTTSLAQQIEHGAPFDLYLSADTEHVDELIAKGRLIADSRAVYARGKLILWIPPQSGADTESMEELAGDDVRFIAVAKPEFAPYGRAAVEALHSARLWARVERKVVYAQNVRMARQFAESGNADAAFVAASLVQGRSGMLIEVDRRLYRPIDQALAVVAGSALESEARKVAEFLLSGRAQTVFKAAGYAAR